MRSGMQASGMPSAAEFALLVPFRGEVPERVFTPSVPLPKKWALRHAPARMSPRMLTASMLIAWPGLWISTNRTP